MTIHERIRQEYALMLAQTPLELAALLQEVALPSSRLPTHPHSTAAQAEVKAFAIQHKIWLADRGDEYNSMFPDLHRSATSKESLVLTGKIYALLWYIDDTMGNEFQKDLSPTAQAQSRQLIGALLDFLRHQDHSGLASLPPEQGLLVAAVGAVMADIQRVAPPGWMPRFLEALYRHIKPAVEDQDSRRTGHLMSIEEYTDSRNDVSGMYVTIRMIELASLSYLDRDGLAAAGLLDDLVKLEYWCAALASFLNDFFSFEKEFIDSDSDYNLLPIVQLNYPEMDWLHAIDWAAGYTCAMWMDFLRGVKCFNARAAHTPYAHQLSAYNAAMVDAVMAAWKWQADNTNRYKRANSIFAEVCTTPLRKAGAA